MVLTELCWNLLTFSCFSWLLQRFVDEGLPTKVFEYQSFGKPIVCCSEGESAMYCEATRSGLVVKPGDAAAVAQAVLRLYRDRKLAWELGWNGWKHVSENLTSERISDRMYKVFLSIRNDRGL